MTACYKILQLFRTVRYLQYFITSSISGGGRFVSVPSKLISWCSTHKRKLTMKIQVGPDVESL